jgi:predicted permease
MFLSLLQQTLNITAPVFAMLFLGVLLKRVGLIDERFIEVGSRLVFNGTLPTLLFLGIVRADMHMALQLDVLACFTVATLGGFAFVWAWAAWRVPREDRGIYIQGAFRGNNGIIGLALAASMYGDFGISLGAVLTGLVILLYNSLSAVALAWYSPSIKSDPLSIAKNVLSNPLILSVLAAIPFAALQVHFPAWLLASGDYFAGLSLPLALICIGGALTLDTLRESGGLALSASAMKMVWLPLLCTFGAWAAGFRGAELGILFLYFASPTAAGSFVMARAAGGNYRLAAAIVVITTLAAALTTNIGILVLQSLQLI